MKSALSWPVNSDVVIMTLGELSGMDFCPDPEFATGGAWRRP